MENIKPLRILILLLFSVVFSTLVLFFSWSNDNEKTSIQPIQEPHKRKPNVFNALVLDLDGNGIDLASIKSNGAVYWEVDLDSFSETVGWVSGNDGFLSLDLNKDEKINNQKELFGSLGSDGYSELDAYDSNSDNVIDNSDPIFKELLVWVDKNSDGFSNKNEISLLSDLGIESINLKRHKVEQKKDENTITQVGAFSLSGQSHEMANVIIPYDNTNTIYNADYALDINALYLPNLRGYGELPDLFVSISMDKTLQDMVYEVKRAEAKVLFEPDFDLSNRIENILFRWAKADDIDPESRGEFIDARKLAFLEKMMGKKFLQLGVHSNPSSLAANKLNSMYNKTLKRLTNHLLIQSSMEAFYGDRAKYISLTGRTKNTKIDHVSTMKIGEAHIETSDKNDAYMFPSIPDNFSIVERGGYDEIWMSGVKEEDLKYEKTEEQGLTIHMLEKSIEIKHQFSEGQNNNYVVEALVLDNGKKIDLTNVIKGQKSEANK